MKNVYVLSFQLNIRFIICIFVVFSLHSLHSSSAYPGLTHDTAQQLLTTEHTMSLRCVLLLAGLAAPALQDNVGWRSFLQENSQEFQDLPLAWQGDTQVPAWLSGTYVRNGPAQVGVCIISDKPGN